jgi:hypothetical protein
MADMAVTLLAGEPYTGVNPLTVERSPEWAAFMRLVIDTVDHL